MASIGRVVTVRLSNIFPSALCALACCGYAARARAAACCGGSYGIGDRLSVMEDAAFSFGVRDTESVAVWTSTGGVVGARSGQFDRELRADASYMVRVIRRLSIGVDVPVLFTWKRLDDQTSSVGGGAGDVSVFGRFDLPSLSASAPNFAVTFATLIPTGRGPWMSTDPLATDVTGLGAAEFRPGLTIDKTWNSRWYALLAGSVGFRAPYHGGGQSVHLAPRGQIIAATGPMWTKVSLTVGALFEIEPGPSVDGVVEPDTDKRRLAATAICAYDFDMRWTAVVSMVGDLPIPGVGKNSPVGIAPSLGVRFAWGM
jgi:hypothetical protein